MQLSFNIIARLKNLAKMHISPPKPLHIPHRVNNSDVAILFIHGFSGDAEITWGDFPSLISLDSRIESWDIHSIGYPSTLRIDVPVWSADPELNTLAIELRTILALPPFSSYKTIAIAAHSMGGLVVQRAILDDQKLMSRISHLFFFGTPSNGLTKAAPFRSLKRQVRDMDQNSPFITKLRDDWNQAFTVSYRFDLYVVAGNRDEFVPSSSSLGPFPTFVQAVVPGNHLEIVKPTGMKDKSVVLVTEALIGRHHARGVVDGARLAVERREFRDVVSTLLPRADQLDDAALVDLALALDGLGRESEALDILERGYKGGTSYTDALGTLGGRLKRRWLAERIKEDLSRSRQLYATGLELALENDNYDQAYYHAINIAFLDLMASPPDSEIASEVREMAKRAQSFCERSADNHWSVATVAEAELIQGNLEKAAELYSRAISMTESPRAVDSMYLQAIRVATRTHGKAGAQCIEEIFGIAK